MRVGAERSCGVATGAGVRRPAKVPRGLAHRLSARTQPNVGKLRLTRHSRRSRGVRAQAVVESLSAVDPAHLHDHLTQVLYSIADADVAAVEPQTKSGFFNFFAGVLETFLKGIDGVLEFANVPYSYGFSIILLTILVKVGTFPLSKKQLESNMQIQALQPRIEKLKEQYADDQERLQLETAKLYKVAEVNPLAGCLPTFVSLPIYIGLYRSLTNAADEGLLTDGFFWIPSLAGPTTIAARQAGTGSAWLFPLENGAPPIGWHDAAAYLVLPVLLIVSQYASQQILQGQQKQSQQQQSANAIIKFLPLMIGWFSLNVPSGLTLYWFTNNLLSVGQTVLLRSNFKAPEIDGDVSTSGGIEVERVSAFTQQKQVAPPPPAERSGDKFWALKQAETAKDGGSVVAEVLSKPASSPERGSKFRELKAKETTTVAAASAEVVAKPAAVTTEVAEPEVQVAEVAEVAEAEEPKPEAGEEASPAPPAPQASGAKKSSAFKKKGKGKGKGGYQKKRR